MAGAKAAGCPSPVIEARLGRAGRHGTNYRRIDPGPPAGPRSAALGIAPAVATLGPETPSEADVLTHARAVDTAPRSSSGTHFLNHQSRRAIERLGAKLDGILRNAGPQPADGNLRRHLLLLDHRQRVADGAHAPAMANGKSALSHVALRSRRLFSPASAIWRPATPKVCRP